MQKYPFVGIFVTIEVVYFYNIKINPFDYENHLFFQVHISGNTSDTNC